MFAGLRLRTVLWVGLGLMFCNLPASAQLFGGGKRRDLERLIDQIDKVPVRTDRDIPVGDPEYRTVGSGKDRAVATRQKRELTNTLESLIAFDPNADVLWPGSLVQGRSLVTGVLSPIPLPRKPLTLTVTGLTYLDPNRSSSERIEHPSNATLQDAIRRLTSGGSPNQPAKMSYTEQRFYSLRDAMLRVGASYEWLTGDAKIALEAGSYESHTNIVVKFVQNYYSMTTDPPVNPTKMFDVGALNMDDARRFIFRDDGTNLGPNPPAYISTVTFGRLLYFFVSSDSSEDRLRAALKVAFDSKVSKGKFEVEAGLRKVIEQSQVRVLVLGGDGKQAAAIISGDLTRIDSVITAGANYGAASAGVPISYQARYLKDNAVARLSFTTDYTVETILQNPARLIAIQAIFHVEDDDKDRDNTVHEASLWNGQVLYDRAHSENVRFYDHLTYNGSSYPLAKVIPLNSCSGLVYRLSKEKDEGWRLRLTVLGTTDDGATVQLATTGKFQLGNGQPNSIDVPLNC